ncbi:aldo/keto reductase [Bacillus sp. OxB-1]|uniref:aldo/keto reductase n=1 Tax=Bacillus sp. (strain OxB-1) TaxID=98228 RepID=UPI0005822AAB|nr:aldo/keto reductase [Bacillus sp. OxB-1]BAQ11245.1 aldo/keto reductase [Bacillus sp. OxB-1]
MQNNEIGQTGLYVNPIGFGANAIGGHNLYPNLDEEAGKELVRQALQMGVNFLDTAYIYGPERSEQLVGEVIKETGMRNKVILATKGAQRITNEGVIFDNSPSFLRQAVEGSLQRLQTDTIDLFYIHFPDEDTPKDEAVGALKDLKAEGKIRAIGVSNFSLDQLKEANKDGYVDVYQGEYNLLNRRAEEDLLPYAKEHGISFVPFYPLASGLLSGKYDKTANFNDFRARLPHIKGESFSRNMEKIDQLRKLTKEKNVEMAHIALAWLLRQECIDVIIPGAKRIEQLENNLKASDVQLTKEDLIEIDAIFA